MKNSKWLIAAIAALAVVAVVLLVVLIVLKPDGTGNEPSNPVETQQQEPTEQGATLDAELGVVDSSIFDEEQTTNPEATETEATAAPTEPDETTEGTTPTEPKETAGGTEPTGAPETKPNPTEPEESIPETSEKPTVPEKKLTYEQFQKLSPEEQQAYQDSFGSIEAFFEWYRAAQEEHNKETNPPIVIGPGGVVDLDKINGK